MNQTKPDKAAEPELRNEILVQMGQEIRTLRRLRGMTMKDLAERTGKTIGFISQVERGLSRPSLATLQDLSDALEVPLAWLFQAGDEESAAERAETRYVLRRNRRRPTAPTSQGTTDYLAMDDFLATPDATRNMGLGITRFRTGGGTGATPEKVEFGFIGLLRAGEVALEIDGETIRLAEGDAFYVPARTPYRIVNRGSAEAEFVWVTAPHGAA